MKFTVAGSEVWRGVMGVARTVEAARVVARRRRVCRGAIVGGFLGGFGGWDGVVIWGEDLEVGGA